MRKVENLEELRCEIQKNIEGIFPWINCIPCGIEYTNKIEDLEYSVKYDYCLDFTWFSGKEKKNCQLIIEKNNLSIRKDGKTSGYVIDFSYCNNKTQMLMELAIYLNKLFS